MVSGTDFPRARKEIVESLARHGAATLHEVMGKSGVVNGVRPVWPGAEVCGSAITVSVMTGDNLAIHEALALAQEGDVLVVAVGDASHGYWGEITTVAAQCRGVVGLVIDGGVRDLASIQRLRFPIFAAGICIHGTAKQLMGLINCPIVCGGAVVRPGDIIRGDEDGVVVVPRDQADRIAEAAAQKDESERRVIEGLRQGHSTLELLGLEARTRR